MATKPRRSKSSESDQSAKPLTARERAANKAAFKKQKGSK